MTGVHPVMRSIDGAAAAAVAATEVRQADVCYQVCPWRSVHVCWNATTQFEPIGSQGQLIEAISKSAHVRQVDKDAPRNVIAICAGEEPVYVGFRCTSQPTV